MRVIVLLGFLLRSHVLLINNLKISSLIGEPLLCLVCSPHGTSFSMRVIWRELRWRRTKKNRKRLGGNCCRQSIENTFVFFWIWCFNRYDWTYVSSSKSNQEVLIVGSSSSPVWQRQGGWAWWYCMLTKREMEVGFYCWFLLALLIKRGLVVVVDNCWLCREEGEGAGEGDTSHTVARHTHTRHKENSFIGRTRKKQLFFDQRYRNVKTYMNELETIIAKGTTDPRHWVLWLIQQLYFNAEASMPLKSWSNFSLVLCCEGQENPCYNFNKSMYQFWKIHVTT